MPANFVALNGIWVPFGIGSCGFECGLVFEERFKGGYTLVTLPRIVTPYRDGVDGTRARVTYKKLVTR